MRLLIVGTGYVGLVTGACFAEMGNHVICLDIDKKKIENLKKGVLPIYERGLQELVERNVREGRLIFTDDYEYGVKDSQICFIAVPTPSTEDGSCDVNYVLQAAREIAKWMPDYRILINKSTVPVGTAKNVKEQVTEVLKNRGVDFKFDVVSNPEFLREGTAVADCLKPDRIIIGTDNPEVATLLKTLYSSFSFNHDRILLMDPVSAELTKYAANAMLATRISFMNELAGFCEKLGADIHALRQGLGADQRIGYQYLYAGLGYGGSCLPKDLRALRAMAQEVDHETPLLDAVNKINQNQRERFLHKISSYFSEEKNQRTIAIWGLSFKPETDDVREAPALHLIEQLLELGATLRVYDPVSIPKAQTLLPDHPRLIWCKDEYEAAKDAHAIALVTEWKQFRFVDFERILETMQGRAFFDGRNQYKPEEMVKRGFEYFGMGTSIA